MRWLFLFVLMLNVAYVAWEITHPEQAAPIARRQADVPGIMLLSEIDTQPVSDEPAAEPAEPVTSLLAQAPATSPAASPQQAAEATSQADAVDDSESAPAAEVSGEQPAAVTVPAQVTASTDSACYTLGPFRKLDKLRGYTRAIKDYVLDASFRSRDEREQSMFWVYLPPRPDRDKARAVGKRLEKMGIKDYYIIHKGDRQNAVSLGHFKQKDRAFAYHEKIRKLGFEPTIEPVFRSYTIYWLDYRVKPGMVIPEDIYAEHLGNNVKRLDRPCS